MDDSVAMTAAAKVAAARVALSTRSARIPPPLLNDWHRWQLQQHRSMLVVLISASLAVFMLFAAVDATLMPGIGELSLRLRLLFTASALLMLAAAYRWVRSPVLWDAQVVPMAVLGAGVVLWLVMHYSGHVSSGYLISTIAFNMAIVLMVQTRFAWILLGNACISLGVLWTLMHLPLNSQAALFEYLSFVLVHCFCLLMGWSRLRMERIAFLRNCLDSAAVDQLHLANRDLRMEADLDPLTGVGNRRALARAFRELEVLHAAGQSGVGLALLDVDHFKPYNDHYGHQAADECLRAIAIAISQDIRDGRRNVFRMGGEEFAVLLSIDDHANLKMLCERLRASVEVLDMPHAARPDGAMKVSISIGASMVAVGQPLSSEALTTRADALLYRAKRDGRNRVQVESAAG